MKYLLTLMFEPHSFVSDMSDFFADQTVIKLYSWSDFAT